MAGQTLDSVDVPVLGQFLALVMDVDFAIGVCVDERLMMFFLSDSGSFGLVFDNLIIFIWIILRVGISSQVLRIRRLVCCRLQPIRLERT